MSQQNQVNEKQQNSYFGGGNSMPNMLDQAMLVKMMDGLFNGNSGGLYNIMLFMLVKPLEKLLNSFIEKTIKKVEDTEMNVYYEYILISLKYLVYFSSILLSFYLNIFMGLILSSYYIYKYTNKDNDIYYDKYIEDKEEITTNQDRNIFEFTFNFQDCFWESLIKKNCLKYDIDNQDVPVKQISRNQFEIKETWNNISFNINENINVQFKNSVEFVFNINQLNKKELKNVTNNNIPITDNIIKQSHSYIVKINKDNINIGSLGILFDHTLFPNVKQFSKKYSVSTDDAELIHNYETKIGRHLKSIKYDMSSIISNRIVNQYIKNEYIKNQDYPSIGWLVFCCAIIIDDKIEKQSISEFNDWFISIIDSNSKLRFFGLEFLPSENSCKFFKELFKESIYFELGLKSLFNLIKLYKKYLKDDFYPMQTHLRTICGFKPYSLNTNNTSDNNKVIISSLDTNLTNNQLQNIFIEYIKNCSSEQNNIEDTVKNKIKVFSIRINKTIEKKKEKNSDYDDFQERFQSLTKTTQDKQFIESFLATSPPQFIETTKIVKTVKSKEINEVYKDFKTMYLSERDKRHLSSVLYNYKHKKQLLHDLGLPLKLGILLYGKPGCGKTSTITTIASYLQKNIYYLNLNGIKSNEELAMIFDSVIKLNSNGGIIVMEDIDAMTTIVHKREEGIQNIGNNEDMDNDETPLSLEFFLNILQGSLTRDDTIFITTTNHIEKLDDAFYRDGRFDVKIEMKPADRFQIREIFKVFFNREIKEDLLNTIKEYEFSPASFISHFYSYLMDSDKYTDEEILQKFIN